MSGGEYGFFIILVSVGALAVQMSTTNQDVQAYAGIAVLAVIVLPMLACAVQAAVSLVREIALEVAVRRGRLVRARYVVVSETTDEGGGTK